MIITIGKNEGCSVAERRWNHMFVYNDAHDYDDCLYGNDGSNGREIESSLAVKSVSCVCVATSAPLYLGTHKT